MKFFTKYSLFANVFSIIFVTIAVLYIGYKAIEGGGVRSKSSPAKRVELTAFNFHYNRYDADGHLTSNFVSEKLEQYENQDTLSTNLTEKSYNEEGEETWRVKAKYGLSQGVLIHLYDNVNAIMFTKDKSANSRMDQTSEDEQNGSGKYSPSEVYIKTSEMYYNSSTKDFYNSKFVKMYDPKTGNNTTGIGVVGNANSKVINLRSDVRSYYATS